MIGPFAVGVLTPAHLAFAQPTSVKPTTAQDPAASQKQDDPRATQLIAAAKADDVDTVKKLIADGVPVNTRQEKRSALLWACANKNFELARWLIQHSAEIDASTIVSADHDNHLPSYSGSQKEFVAYLVISKLLQKGMPLLPKATKAQADFVRLSKEAIIEYLKTKGPWPTHVNGWAVRLVDVRYAQENKASFFIQCDVAAWTNSAMFEVASKTGLLQSKPPGMDEVFSHVWLMSSVNPEVSVLSLNFQKDRVLNGDFLVTRKTGNLFTAEHVADAGR
jgi:hypothetical protein